MIKKLAEMSLDQFYKSKIYVYITISLFSINVVKAESLLGFNDWQIVAHISNKGGMFDGDSNLSPSFKYGSFVPNPTPETPDFYRPFPFSNPGTKILFITGNRKYWIMADYEKLQTIINAKKGDFTPNLSFEAGINGKALKTNGNVLFRESNSEDPWISIEGEHFQGVANGLIIWGENDYNDHLKLKEENGGIDVFIRKSDKKSVPNTIASSETSIFNGHDYILSAQKKNWHMAKKDAEKRGGYLVVINNEEEQKHIEKILNQAFQNEKFQEPVWIGFSDEKKEGTWKWVNGDKVTFTFWAKNQPSNANGITPENYAVIWQPNDNIAEKGQWNDLAGDCQLRYLIEYDEELGLSGSGSKNGVRSELRSTR
jgi:hypothetical protein